MKKLRLKVDELTVESFDTSAAAGARGGTVRAHESAENNTCLALCTNYNCQGGGTGPTGCLFTDCGYTCNGDFECNDITAWQTCPHTCDDRTCFWCGGGTDGCGTTGGTCGETCDTCPV